MKKFFWIGKTEKRAEGDASKRRVEIVSPGARDVRRDRIEKPSEYAAFGVRRLWLIDPEARTIEGWVLGVR